MPNMVEAILLPVSHRHSCCLRTREHELLSMLMIRSRTAACVLVLMQVLGALFECQGCVPPHIRKERSDLA